MSQQIKVPTFPESISEGTIATWHKKEGDTVAQDEVILEIETDKVVMEVPSPADGIINGITRNEGDTVLSEEVIGQITDGAPVVAAAVEAAAAPATVSAPGPAQGGEVSELKAPSFPESISEGTIATWHKQPGDAIAEGETIVEIETDKVMMEVPASVAGTLIECVKAEGDTVLSNEVIGKVTTGAAAPATADDSPAPEADAVLGHAALSPAVRRAVKANDVDASQISGTGKGGRVTKQDVAKHVATPVAKPAVESKAPAVVATQPEYTGDRPEKRVKMTRLRQTIARRLVDVQQTNAILTTFNEVDMKPVMDMRKQYKDLFLKTHDAKLGFMSFFLKATTEALKRFPEVNASIDGTDVVYHGYFDIGVAVGSERGLVVPVIRNTDQLSFAEIESTVVEKAIKARDGKLSLEEMQGGTFTITNGGTYGSMLSTPIINAPQSAILGMHNIVERPVVQNGEIVIRPIMYIALSYDHRIIDGGTSVRFLKTIKELIEDPARMLLQV
jgi:2-oxoglutarate dehydrogenase E2 component (dihydrolipoamide succinyltransferase)